MRPVESNGAPMSTIPELTNAEIIEAAEAHLLGDLPRMLVTGGSERMRIGVFGIQDDGNLALMLDAYPTEDDIVGLATGLELALLGRWDARDTGKWRFAWTLGSENWTLWSRQAGKAYWIEEGKLHRSGPRPPLDTAQIAAVQTYASPGWYEQGAEVRLEEGTTIEIAETTNWAARLDPGYDFDCLRADLSWAEALARDLAEQLGVPVGEALPERPSA